MSTQQPILAEAQSCTGCSACAQICPVNAIDMSEGIDGFLYPTVNSDVCISCGACTRSCPVVTKKGVPCTTEPQAWGCTLKDADDLFNSTSGGFFFALASQFVEQGGVVFGAALDDDLRVRHHAASTVAGLQPLRKSKYVQSELGNTFRAIRTLLRRDSPVLFVGTPCQCAGLKSFLGGADEHLLTVEVFCGQITGNLSWRSYLDEREREHGSKVTSALFRMKPSIEDSSGSALGLTVGGWKDPHLSLSFADGTTSRTRWTKDPWTVAYVNTLMARRSCSACPFKQQTDAARSDIAIGDFWGVENNAPSLYSPAGVSAVLTYSEAGARWVSRLSSLLHIEPVDLAAVRRGNPDVWASAKEHAHRNAFLEELASSEGRPFSDAVAHALGLEGGRTGSATFGVWGGFNLRQAVIGACGPSGNELAYHISNISLTSLVGKPFDIPTGTRLPKNQLRNAMLALDASKSVFCKPVIERIRAVDYLVVDLMEDRYGTALMGDAALTLSDAFKDSSLVPTGATACLDTPEDCWQASYLAFIEHLKGLFVPRQLVLVRSFLSECYQDANGKLVRFPDAALGRPVSKINAMLEQRYAFLLEHCSFGHVIDIPSSLRYCQAGHKHGVMPSHSNGQSNAHITAELLRIIREESA